MIMKKEKQQQNRSIEDCARSCAALKGKRIYKIMSENEANMKKTLKNIER